MFCPWTFLSLMVNDHRGYVTVKHTDETAHMLLSSHRGYVTVKHAAETAHMLLSSHHGYVTVNTLMKHDVLHASRYPTVHAPYSISIGPFPLILFPSPVPVDTHTHTQTQTHTHTHTHTVRAFKHTWNLLTCDMQSARCWICNITFSRRHIWMKTFERWQRRHALEVHPPCTWPPGGGYKNMHVWCAHHLNTID